jgi:hypothetical protein
MPQIAASFDGFDQTSNFGGLTELNVPVDIGYHKVVPQQFSSKELRVESALRNRATAAKQRLASDINMAIFNTVALQGSVFSKRTVAPTGFDGAYENARINSDIAGFDVLKNDQTVRLAAAAGGSTTVNGAGQFHEPAATEVGSVIKVDNRYSNLTVTAANYAGIKAGDAFTIAGVNSVHMVTKQDTGQLQTFRVISKPSANVIRVAPAIISNGAATRAGAEYQNVTATPAAGAAITWLNTTTAELNPFFMRGALLLVPGSYAVDPEDGWQVMRGRTESGLGFTYTRQGEINDLSVKCRWEVDFGTALTNPQMAGAQLFGQA